MPKSAKDSTFLAAAVALLIDVTNSCTFCSVFSTSAAPAVPATVERGAIPNPASSPRLEAAAADDNGDDEDDDNDDDEDADDNPNKLFPFVDFFCTKEETPLSLSSSSTSAAFLMERLEDPASILALAGDKPPPLPSSDPLRSARERLRFDMDMFFAAAGFFFGAKRRRSLFTSISTTLPPE